MNVTEAAAMEQAMQYYTSFPTLGQGTAQAIGKGKARSAATAGQRQGIALAAAPAVKGGIIAPKQVRPPPPPIPAGFKAEAGQAEVLDEEPPAAAATSAPVASADWGCWTAEIPPQGMSLSWGQWDTSLHAPAPTRATVGSSPAIPTW